jgi:hypothetical protein
MCTNSTTRETDSIATVAFRCASIVQDVHNFSVRWYCSLQVRACPVSDSVLCITAREKNDLEAQGLRRKLKSRVFRRLVI